MLVDPTPRSLKNLDAWKNFWARVRLLKPAQLEAKAIDLCLQQEKAYAPVASNIRRQLKLARAEEDLARELVRIALWVGDLKAYASYPTKDKAFPIDPEVWGDMGRDYHDAHRSIEEGIFAIDSARWGPNSIERELANKPLFIAKEGAIGWLRIRPSLAQQSKIAKAIINQHKLMRREDFKTAMTDAVPGLSRSRAMQLWREHVPEEWKKPGRKLDD